MSKYTGNGQFTLTQLSLFYNAGSVEKEVDLTLAYVQLDLYESIFDMTMSGSVSIVDTFNMQDVLPLYGNERIEIDFHTQGNDGNPIRYRGVVYKVTEKHRITEHSSGYTIHFVSEEALNSQRSVVNRSFNETPSAIVSQLYQSISNGKPINVINTRVVEPYAFGNVKPLQVISMLANHSVSTNNDTGYVFYEDSRQFNFVPLQHLYQQKPARQYRSRNRGMYDDDSQRVQESHGTFQDVKILEENSYLDRLNDGQHGSTVIRYDLKSKSYDTYTYTKDGAFDGKSLGRRPYKKDVTQSPVAKMRLTLDHDPGIEIQTPIKNFQQIASLNTIRVEATVFGDSFNRCGTVIDAYLPIWNKDQQQVTDNISGHFLITEIHHQLNQEEQYLQTIMLQKDAYI